METRRGIKRITVDEIQYAIHRLTHGKDRDEAVHDARKSVKKIRGAIRMVRFDFGERYQNLALAKEVRYTCSPSSPQAGIKRAMYRCTTEAIPCRSAGN